MEGNIPTKLDSRSSDKYALPVSPLDVCLGYFATSCLKPTEEPDIETDVEAMSFVLTSLLDDYDSIYCLNFQQLFQLLMDAFNDYIDRAGGNLEISCEEILIEFQNWVCAPQEELCSLIFDLFDNLEQSIPKSDSWESISRDFGPESMSLIHCFARRILVGFHSMSFEQVDVLLTELRMYATLSDSANAFGMEGSPIKESYILYKHASKIEQILEKEILTMRSGIRKKKSIIDTLEEQCDALQAHSTSGNSKSLLQGRATVALERQNDQKSINCMHEFSDAPESSFTRRVRVREEEPDETHRETIIEAALNVAMVQARLGQMKEAMQMVNEHMRVSQQASNGEFLVYSLAALCYILSRAVPGSLELQTGTIPCTTPAERHYLEMEALLKRLYTRSEDENLPEISLFARLLLAEQALLHPKKQRDSSLGTFDHMHQKMDSRDKSKEFSSPGFSRLQKPCVASTESLDTCLYAKDLAYELAHLSSVGPSKGNSVLYLAPKASGTHSISQSDARKGMEAMQSCQTADQIRAAGWLLWGSSRLSLSSAMRILHSSNKNDSSEISALSLILINVYEQFGVDPIDKLSCNGKLQSLLEENISLQRSWDIIKQRRAVNARQSRLAIKLAARVQCHPKTNEVTHIQNKVECRELTALAYLSGGYYEDADKAALSGYTLARNACMSTYALRLLLLRGRIHVESGSWETAFPHVCSVLEQYREMGADVLGAEASMYMAHIWSRMGSKYIDRSLDEMNACMYILLAHANLETKGIARVTLARLMVQKAGGFTELDHACCETILRLLRDAEVDFSKIRDWKQKAHVLHMASIIYNHMGNEQSRDACAKACLQLRKTMYASASHLYTDIYVHI